MSPNAENLDFGIVDISEANDTVNPVLEIYFWHGSVWLNWEWVNSHLTQWGCLFGAKPLPESMLDEFTDAYMRH